MSVEVALGVALAAVGMEEATRGMEMVALGVRAMTEAMAVGGVAARGQKVGRGHERAGKATSRVARVRREREGARRAAGRGVLAVVWLAGEKEGAGRAVGRGAEVASGQVGRGSGAPWMGVGGWTTREVGVAVGVGPGGTVVTSSWPMNGWAGVGDGMTAR